ncbi:MAG: NUDIX domain-containing protein [Salinibacterium sp.]|nr:NUDIX domain-containing protein [Planctomycetota bacterium]MCB1282227.1 NUDIX domain-containing protein [Salinibacterium sp.]
MIENLIFDWSGTLCDDIQATLDATNRTLQHFGATTIDLATYRREFRIPVIDFYGPRLPGRTLEEIDGYFFAEMIERVAAAPLFEGAAGLLHAAAQRKQRLFILSTMPTDLITTVLRREGLNELFEEVCGHAFDKHRYLPQLIERHGLAPDTTLFIGDSAHDVEVGLACGVRSAAALWGYSTADRFDDLAADDRPVTLAAFADLLDRDHLLGTVPLVIPTVGGILVDPDDRILIVRTKKWSDTFGIPGGKIDYGETMLAAYEREMVEETGLVPEQTRFVMIQDCIEAPEFTKRRHFLLINYLSRVSRPEGLRHNYEIEEARWATVAEALELRLNQPTRVVIEEAIRQELLEAP